MICASWRTGIWVWNMKNKSLVWSQGCRPWLHKYREQFDIHGLWHLICWACSEAQSCRPEGTNLSKSSKLCCGHHTGRERSKSRVWSWALAASALGPLAASVTLFVPLLLSCLLWWASPAPFSTLSFLGCLFPLLNWWLIFSCFSRMRKVSFSVHGKQ